MTKADPAEHTITVAVALDPANPVPAGAPVQIAVSACCSAGCDLQGRTLSVLRDEQPLASLALAPAQDEARHTAAFTIDAPASTGEHALEVRLDPGDGPDPPATVVVSLITVPHDTSMATWDVPFPIVEGAPFSLKVGVACARHCCLSNHEVQIRDETGTVRATARLSPAPWPDTAALHWAEVQLSAPRSQAHFQWVAAFTASGADAPHAPAETTITFATSKPPEFEVRARILEGVSGAAVADAEIRLGRYEVFTNEAGEASLFVPAGTYVVSMRKDGFDLAPTTLSVQKDEAVELEAERVPTHAQLVDMMKRFEGDYWRP